MISGLFSLFQARAGHLCLVLNVSEEALSPKRDVPVAHGALIAPGLPGKVWDFVIDVHDVHPQRCGGSEPLAIPHFHSEVVTVRRTFQVRESSFEMWGGRREQSLFPFCRPLQVLLEGPACYAHPSFPTSKTPLLHFSSCRYHSWPPPHMCSCPPSCTLHLHHSSQHLCKVCTHVRKPRLLWIKSLALVLTARAEPRACVFSSSDPGLSSRLFSEACSLPSCCFHVSKELWQLPLPMLWVPSPTLSFFLSAGEDFGWGRRPSI